MNSTSILYLRLEEYNVLMKQLFLLCVICSLSDCSEMTVSNPQAVLNEIGRSPRIHLKAMEQVEQQLGLEHAEFQQTLHLILWKPGYTNEVRMAALHRLWLVDKEGVVQTLRQKLPRLNNWTWLVELSNWIAEHRVTALNEGLISSWASPTGMVQSEDLRPEYIALVQMHGKEKVVDLIFKSLVESNQHWQQAYRSRCWDLLHRIGERARLVTMLEEFDIPEDDLYLQDLRRSLIELGIVPHGREEIIWIRKLASPEYETFWNEAIDSLNALSDSRRASLELRDIPIAVSVRRHATDQLNARTATAVGEIHQALKDATHYYETEGGGTFSHKSESFSTHRDVLTWGDAMAIKIILQAIDVKEVRAHLFDYAMRDFEDKTTEYGGVIALDEKGRFEILEFKPTIRHHDRRFNASQQMFDAAYTALFHFHFHAQKINNGDHAGPGLGDKAYAESTRANCLVFSLVDEHTMNVDFYRHSGVVVDLGTVSLQ